MSPSTSATQPPAGVSVMFVTMTLSVAVHWPVNKLDDTGAVPTPGLT